MLRQHLADQIVTLRAVLKASYPLQTQIFEAAYAIAELYETSQEWGRRPNFLKECNVLHEPLNSCQETHGNSGIMHVQPAGNDQGLPVSAHASHKADFGKCQCFASMHIILRCALAWSLFCMQLVSLCRLCCMRGSTTFLDPFLCC